jgi:hypothetical protein
MRVLVACEFSGRVRDAFIRQGHEAISCDLLPTELPGPHYQGDVLDILNDGWDLMVAHPPCTHLASSGARWWSGRQQEQAHAVQFAETLWSSGIPRIAIENPVGALSTRSRLGKPTEIIQPWMFGHNETKATCLWLKGLPILKATNIVSGREQRIHRMPASADRWKNRSRTYPGISEAMAKQWGELCQ